MSETDVLNFLGLIARSRKLATGETALKSIQNKKASFVIIASDASDNTKKKFSDKCKFYGVDYVVWNTSDALSHAIGKDNRMVIAILDRGFASGLKKKLGG